MVSKLRVTKPGSKVVRTKCRKLDPKELKSQPVQQQIEQLIDFVYTGSNKGTSRDRRKPNTVGLSANQVGINMAICVVDFGIGSNKFNDLHVLINPKIVWQSKTQIDRQEGCVNLEHGNIRGIVPRSKRVKVEALDRFGTKLTIDARGLVARVLQHEIDHLNGRLLIDRIPDPRCAHYVTDEDRILYGKTKKEQWKKFIDVSKLAKKAD